MKYIKVYLDESNIFNDCYKYGYEPPQVNIAKRCGSYSSGVVYTDASKGRTEDKQKANVGDIVTASTNKYGTSYYFYGADYYANNKDSIKSTPIGVVVIPASHNDGKIKCMSLVNMDCNNPENGGHDTKIYGNGANKSLSDYEAYDGLITVVPGTSTTSFTQVSTLPYTTLASDIGDIWRSVDPNDKEVGWHSFIYYSIHYVPSPYKNNDISDVYRQETYTYVTGITKKNATSDMDGNANTTAYTDKATEDGIEWHDGTIKNTSLELPAPCCCKRFRTIGTSSGQWYMPSSGELGYVAARYSRILSSLALVGDTLCKNTTPYYMSSTLGSDNHKFMSINLQTNEFSANVSSSLINVRAFIEL